MLEKIVDVLRQVFWLKKSRKKRSQKSSNIPSRPAKKKTTRKKIGKVRKNKPVQKSTPLQKPVKSAARPIKAPKNKKLDIDPSLTQVGEITHYFERIKVGVVKVMHGSILVGDRLTIKTKTGSFIQKVWSMQVESQDVKVAKKGQLIGLKLDKPVGIGDIVYK